MQAMLGLNGTEALPENFILFWLSPCLVTGLADSAPRSAQALGKQVNGVGLICPETGLAPSLQHRSLALHDSVCSGASHKQDVSGHAREDRLGADGFHAMQQATSLARFFPGLAGGLCT